MKSLLTILTLVFTVMFSSTSYAEWKEVGKSVEGNTFYIDFDRIRKHDGYVYFWNLTDLLKPNKYGDFSSKMYKQVDCNLFKQKLLSYTLHKLPMGGDVGETLTPTGKSADWTYPPPSSVQEHFLKLVCRK